ncbi:MAG TPA: STAS domain-containing protein [Bacteriovoracaceae bacterium]|nr:STAS domain-containing protein [Bacteriovoracaceae bacterium]
MEKSFDLKITSKFGYEVITLSGRITKDAKDNLETCTQEIINSTSKTFILFFNDVSVVDNTVLRELTLLQQEIRKKKVELFLVGLGSEIKQQLIDKGIIRMSEVRKSLEEVVHRSRPSAA